MSNKIAIVTGANKGLGYAIVKGLCEEFDGVVYLTSRNKEYGIESCKTLERDGLNPEYHQLDVTSTESVRNFFLEIKLKGNIDILVNNAGVLFLKDATEAKLYQAEQTLKVNFFALVDFTESILPLMRDGGTIVNISSSSGHLCRIPSEDLRKTISSEDLNVEQLKGLMRDYLEAVRVGKEIENGWGDSPYVVSKVGVNAYTFILNRRLSTRGIFVNCVHPGYVMSDMTRGGGAVTPAQGAETPLQVALRPPAGGLYVWHNGASVPWDGPDPRGYIDDTNVPLAASRNGTE